MPHILLTSSQTRKLISTSRPCHPPLLFHLLHQSLRKQPQTWLLIYTHIPSSKLQKKNGMTVKWGANSSLRTLRQQPKDEAMTHYGWFWWLPQMPASFSQKSSSLPPQHTARLHYQPHMQLALTEGWFWSIERGSRSDMYHFWNWYIPSQCPPLTPQYSLSSHSTSWKSTHRVTLKTMCWRWQRHQIEKKQHSWITVYREEFSADQEYHFGTLCKK